MCPCNFVLLFRRPFLWQNELLTFLSLAIMLTTIAATAVAQLPVTNGLQMWFEGSNYDDTTMTWTDMSGNGYDAVVVDGLPTKVASSAFNEQSVVHFDNDEVYGQDSLGITFPVSSFDVNNNTTFIVGLTDTEVNGSLLYLGNYASYAPNWHWWGYSTYMRPAMPTHQQDRAVFGGYDGTESTILSTGTGNLDTPFLFTGVGSSTGREFFIDGGFARYFARLFAANQSRCKISGSAKPKVTRITGTATSRKSSFSIERWTQPNANRSILI